MTMTGFVYAFRYGDGDHVKIGSTNDLKKRRQALQGAHHHPLVEVDNIEHKEYKEGERYLHRRLAARKVQDAGVGAREHFLLSDAELHEVFEETRRYLDYDLPLQRELPKYESLEAGEDMLPATEDMRGVKHRIGELRAERARLQPEQDLLDDEVREVYDRQRTKRERLARRLHELDVEENQLATTVKLRIGPAAGIEGLATWRSERKAKRKFDPEWVKEDAPELFDQYRTGFDQTRFKEEQPAEYEAHMRVLTQRVFRWMEEPDPCTQEQGFGRDQPERQLVQNRVLRTARPRPVRRRRQ